jgi:hypothetical protein
MPHWSEQPQRLEVTRSVLGASRLVAEAMNTDGATRVVLRRDDVRVMSGYREHGRWHVVVTEHRRRLKRLQATLREWCACDYCAGRRGSSLETSRSRKDHELVVTTGCPVRVHRLVVALSADRFSDEIRNCVMSVVGHVENAPLVVLVPQLGREASPGSLQFANDDIARMTSRG